LAGNPGTSQLRDLGRPGQPQENLPALVFLIALGMPFCF
jgi:hypothetical protein